MSFLVVIMTWMLTWTLFTSPKLVIIVTALWHERSISILLLSCIMGSVGSKVFGSWHTLQIKSQDISASAEAYCTFYNCMTIFIETHHRFYTLKSIN